MFIQWSRLTAQDMSVLDITIELWRPHEKMAMEWLSFDGGPTKMSVISVSQYITI